jgi:regulatory subunit for Cdc7p protein kinase
MGMKIWQAEKLQRVLATVLDGDPTRTQQSKSTTSGTRAAHEDLSQVLRNDRIGLPAERDPTSSFRDITVFKGPFIYIHDIDEKYKPTMVREYPAVARRADGEWPQFRSASAGRCPFVEDPTVKKEMEAKQKSQQRQIQQQEAAEVHVPRTRSSVNLEIKMDPPRRASPRKALQEVRNLAPPPPPATINPGLLSKTTSRDSSLSFPPMPDQKFDFARPPFLHIPREPAASGIQRSNLTSAIQSNMISSTAATGVKAGTSKEVHELKRKVLERSHTGSLSVGSIPSSHRMNELAGALKNARAPAPQRAAKSKAQEKLGGIQEEDPYADDVEAERHAQRRKKSVQKEKEAKPGYCENCRDKYEDFEEVSHLFPLFSRLIMTDLMIAYCLTKTSQVCGDDKQLDRAGCAVSEVAGSLMPPPAFRFNALPFRHLGTSE